MSRVPALVLSLLLILGLNLPAKDKGKDEEPTGEWLPITQQDVGIGALAPDGKLIDVFSPCARDVAAL